MYTRSLALLPPNGLYQDRLALRTSGTWARVLKALVEPFKLILACSRTVTEQHSRLGGPLSQTRNSGIRDCADFACQTSSIKEHCRECDLHDHQRL